MRVAIKVCEPLARSRNRRRSLRNVSEAFKQTLRRLRKCRRDRRGILSGLARLIESEFPSREASRQRHPREFPKHADTKEPLAPCGRQRQRLEMDHDDPIAVLTCRLFLLVLAAALFAATLAVFANIYLETGLVIRGIKGGREENLGQVGWIDGRQLGVRVN